MADVEYIMPVDSVVLHLPLPGQFGGMSECNLNPGSVPGLEWSLSATLNAESKTIQVGGGEMPDKNTIVFQLS